ncbi:hypothetical protein [Tardiphaga sp. 813_E8_N1_3]|uniref:hypothetical protein n=1 Tax=Tardiphaga sp. 813_E8_N1_3 TaxID=3240760 RepID=UPI003F289790
MLETGVLKGLQFFTKLVSVLDFNDRQDRVLIEQAIQSLRQIYFFPSDLLEFLRQISDGASVDDDLVSELVEIYDDVRAPRIEDALSFLRNRRFERSQRLTIADMRSFEEIANGKISVRQSVRRFLHNYASRPSSTDWALEASRILGQILRLNDAIEQSENQLRIAMRAHRNTVPAQGTPRLAKKKTAKSRPTRS